MDITPEFIREVVNSNGGEVSLGLARDFLYSRRAHLDRYVTEEGVIEYILDEWDHWINDYDDRCLLVWQDC